MKKGMIIFWGLYLLFFCIPFPIIIYTATASESDMPASSMYWSWFWLAVSAILWLYLICFFVNQFLLIPVKNKSIIQDILKNGIQRKGIVTDRIILKNETTKNQQLLQLKLRFENLNLFFIEDELFFVDSRPEENRFEKGKEINVLLNRNASSGPPFFVLEGQKTQYNVQSMVFRVLGLVLFMVYIAGVYLYFYNKESKDTGWQFLTFMHPIIFSGFMILLFVLVYQLILQPLMFGKKWHQRLLYTGKKTAAEIRNVRQTGTYVNEQPEIRFDVSYTSDKGVVYQAIYKKIVPLMDLSKLQREGLIDIFYNDIKPEKIVIPNIFKD
ncbi:hypothetical protein KRE47_11145 [Elizabethkingia meningoseptica]|uniref:hypothetical protein n=1 Tax=Elizabethkingia meningoseptica TaxID=238 RepID=UPI0023AFEF10|nr:hypothetical protein [Elizabethkingia meningoseptica]MDE5468692.1 hypothetical protein [Elizabethkingia meningoseptica]MDE5476004.1 hypothetical protein [Elizabethkingia meningoseptica]MDE5478939.1 hypothetical protein [Elizabethkingia meningoseptica]MDE5484888.1 hypothetical protein [Elizabethkingia meningoseptica]MDE5502340.1 hypothetical protein [Elizabethkingia meningoseptica]